MIHYAKCNTMKRCKFYTDNLLYMTTESLHSKSDITKELAHRDVAHDLRIELMDEIGSGVKL